MRRGRGGRARKKGGGKKAKRSVYTTTIAMHSCRNDETFRTQGDMRGGGGWHARVCNSDTLTHTAILSPSSIDACEAPLYVPHPSRASFRRCVRIRAVIDSWWNREFKHGRAAFWYAVGTRARGGLQRLSIMPVTLQRGASGSATNAERVRNDRLFQ